MLSLVAATAVAFSPPTAQVGCLLGIQVRSFTYFFSPLPRAREQIVTPLALLLAGPMW